jgi:hypothetical protein
MSYAPFQRDERIPEDAACLLYKKGNMRIKIFRGKVTQKAAFSAPALFNRREL